MNTSSFVALLKFPPLNHQSSSSEQRIMFAFYFTMPINRCKCSPEVLQHCQAHKCSNSRKTHSFGNEINPNLLPDQQFQVCYNLHSISSRGTTQSNVKSNDNCNDDTERASINKKARRSQEDILLKEFRGCKHKKGIRTLTAKQRMKRIMPLACNVFASVIDLNEFENF